MVYRGHLTTRAKAEKEDDEGRRRACLIRDNDRAIEINEDRYEMARAKFFAALITDSGELPHRSTPLAANFRSKVYQTEWSMMMANAEEGLNPLILL